MRRYYRSLRRQSYRELYWSGQDALCFRPFVCLDGVLDSFSRIEITVKMLMNILVFLIFAGCASTVRVPTNSFIRSENVGQGGASIETFITQATRLQVAQDLRAAPIDGTPRADDTVALGLHGSLGFLKALELYWGWVPGGPNTAGLKLQLWGESIRASKAGNFSLSLA